MRGTSQQSTFEWARRVGDAWRHEPGAVRLSPTMRVLLSVAFGGELSAAKALRGRELIELHDRAIGVACVLSGFSHEVLAERAARDHRSEEFAVATAWAWAAAAREPISFRRACSFFRKVREDHHDGVIAGLLGAGGRGRSAVYERAVRIARRALAEDETWALVATLRAARSRVEGRDHALRDMVEPGRLVHDAGYRLGYREGTRVRSSVPDVDVRAELRAARRSDSSPSTSDARR